MAITMRRGDVTKFLPSKLLPGEWAVVLDNDPTTGERARTRAALGLSPVGVQAMAANVASADDGGKSVVLSDAAGGIAALRRGFVDDIRRLHDNP